MYLLIHEDFSIEQAKEEDLEDGWRMGVEAGILSVIRVDDGEFYDMLPDGSYETIPFVKKQSGGDK